MIPNGLALAIALTFSSALQDTAEQRRQAILDRADELLQELDLHGVGIAVFEQGEISWADGRGIAVAKDDRPVTAATRFQAASISKPVTAFAVLRMVERGEFGLDDDIEEILLDWELPEHEFTEPVTPRRLLSHSAGTTVHGFPGFPANQPAASLLDVLAGKGNTPAVVVDVEPGTIERYSGGGYCILERMLTGLTDEPFHQVLADLVLEPIGMAQSTFRQPPPAELAADLAHAYLGKDRPVAGDWHVYPQRAAAGLWTTPSDLARYALEVRRAWRGESELLGPELARDMLTRQLPTGRFGLGLMVAPGDRLIYRHSGGNMGFCCDMVALAEPGSGYVIMTNDAGGGAVLQQLGRFITSTYGWAGEE